MEILKDVLKFMLDAKKRWCADEVDDAKDMWTEYPTFLEEAIPILQKEIDNAKELARRKNAVSSCVTLRKKLQVWWIPQVPMKAFTFDVDSLAEGVRFLDILAKYDQFQFANRIKPDYCNVGGINQWSEDCDGEGHPGWESWADDETGEDNPELFLEKSREKLAELLNIKKEDADEAALH